MSDWPPLSAARRTTDSDAMLGPPERCSPHAPCILRGPGATCGVLCVWRCSARIPSLPPSRFGLEAGESM